MPYIFYKYHDGQVSFALTQVKHTQLHPSLIQAPLMYVNGYVVSNMIKRSCPFTAICVCMSVRQYIYQRSSEEFMACLQVLMSLSDSSNRIKLMHDIKRGSAVFDAFGYASASSQNRLKYTCEGCRGQKAPVICRF